MKVVINTCFGGFGLSPTAMKRYLELQGKPCYFFSADRSRKHHPLSMSEAGETFSYSTYTIPNPDEVDSITRNSSYVSVYNIPRTDPFLIQVIEELGSEANDAHSSLKIIDIPDDVEYEIEEYDGREQASEIHRIWY